MEIGCLSPIQEQTLQSLNTFSKLYRKPKKYQLKYLFSEQEKNIQAIIIENCKKSKKKNVESQQQYFANIRKNQMQTMFQNSFIKKLKSSIVLNSPPNHSILSDDHFQIDSDYKSIFIPKNIQSLLLFLSLLISTFMLILISLTFIFSEVSSSRIVFYYLIFCLIVNLFEIFKKFINHTTFQQQKITTIRKIIQNYMQRQFRTDLIIVLSLVVTLATNVTGTVSIISRILLFLKIKEIMFMISYLQNTFLKNVYKQQIWSLIKVFLFNFMFAHIITIILIFMTSANQQNNWLIKKGIQNSGWSQIYAWAYYWATTIMLTVGFGDLTPTTTLQATCMIFIQMISCMILAYNFNCVGTILTKIRSYEAQKQSNLKTFNYMKENSNLNQQTTGKIMNYIKQSTQMKRNFNVQEEKQFLEKLPASFKHDLLKEKNRKIWDNLMFFRNLSQKTLLNLSVRIQKKLAHPGEIVYKCGTQIDLILFNKGGYGYSYNNGRARKNGTIVQSFQVDQQNYKIISLDFLTGKTLKYDILCTDYSMVYKISRQNLISILKQNSYDFEYYSMIKDRDNFLTNQFQPQPCQICHKQRHSLFKCSKLHYMPLNQHVIQKNKSKIQKKCAKILSQNRTLVKIFKPLKELKSLNKIIIIYRNKRNRSMTLLPSSKSIQIENLKEHECTNDSLDNVKQAENSEIQINKTSFDKSKIKISSKCIYQEAVNQIKDRLLGDLSKPGKFDWDVQSDAAHNYRIYFRKDNPDEISYLTSQKIKKIKKKRNFYPFSFQKK